jgi:hypothetical protein
MTATLTPPTALRPKQTAVRRVQPSMDGGRPADPLTLAFEGDLEGLIATTDDRLAIQHALVHLHKYESAKVLLVTRICASRATRVDEQKLRKMNAITDRLVRFLADRAARLGAVVIPELQRITTATADVLEFRERDR